MKSFRKNRRITKVDPSASKSGFTIIELSLAMAFIAVLLIIIAIVATSLVSVYQKGLSIKAVNGVGRNLIDEFTRAINTAPSVDTTSLCNSLATGNVAGCVNDHANKYIYLEQRSNPDPTTGRSEQYNGVFCTGYYSYIWNTKAGLESSPKHTVSLKYLDNNGNTQTLSEPRLARITDKTYRLCSANVDNDYISAYPYGTTLNGNTTIDITKLANNSGDDLDNRIETPVTDFLRLFDTDLALYDLTIFPISQDSVTLRSFFSGTFVLATLRGNVNILGDGDYCDPNGFRSINADGTVETSSSQTSLGSEFNYCAINKFNFAARTAGSGV